MWQSIIPIATAGLICERSDNGMDDKRRLDEMCRLNELPPVDLDVGEWRWLASNVRMSHALPEREEFTADIYECAQCHNKANDRDGLPRVCPWCGADMEKESQQ